MSGPDACALSRKSRNAGAQGLAIEVTRAAHVEAGRLEGLGDEARVIGRGGERVRLVGGVADHEGDAFFGFRPRRRDEYER